MNDMRVRDPICAICDKPLAADTPTGFLAPGTGRPSLMLIGECKVYGWLPAHKCEAEAA